MTVKQQAPTKKSHSSPEVAQKLVEIEQTLIRHNKFVEALAALMQLATENLQDAQVWLLVGLVYTRMAHWQNAIGVLKTALQLDPSNNSVKQLMSLALFSIGQKDEACKLIDTVCKSGSATGPQWMLRAYLHQHTSTDPMHALSVARDWGKRFADPLTRLAKPIQVKDRNPRKILKIGYVTADFREHSVAFFMQPVLAHHDPEKVEVHVYSNGSSDAVTEQLRALVPHWHDIQTLTDEELHSQIRAEGIDVLVDLSGYTHGHRLGVFARRAAPVQVTWLGYMHTLGMSAMDYRISDAGIAPPSHRKFYKENIFYVRCMASYVPPIYSPIGYYLPMEKNGYPTLVSLNSSGKITDDTLSLWSKILAIRKDARLIIMVKEHDNEAAQISMQPRVEAAGMPLDRVSVLKQVPLNNFMEMGFVADLALDTFPISGGTTTLHTLWMGMPVVTMSGERSSDSASANTLRAVGLNDWVAEDCDDYINKVLDWINSGERLKEVKSSIRAKMSSSPLMDYKGRVRDLENAFRIMWINYLDNDLKCNDIFSAPQELLKYLEQS